jgi:hypothetical protein
MLARVLPQPRAGFGVTPSQAALIAGLGMLIMTVTAPVAELVIYPKLVVPGDGPGTMQNVLAGRGLLLALLFCGLILFLCDLTVAWALRVLLAPVNQALASLAAWLRAAHALIAFGGVLKLATILRIVSEPDYAAQVGIERLQAQVLLLLQAFRAEWSFSLVLFAIHLGLVGWLVQRSGYIPRFLGLLVLIAAAGHLLVFLGPFLYPDADLRLLIVALLGEMVFMLWLLVRGRSLQQARA